MRKVFFVLLMSIFALVAQADVSAGDVASNTSDILETVTSIIMVILYVAAMGVFVSACMKYRIHRQNPQQIPLSTPVTELVLAIVLAALPTVSKMTNEHLFQDQQVNLIQEQRTPQGAGGIKPAQVYQQQVAPQQHQYPQPAQPGQPVQQQYQPPQYQAPQYTPPQY